jgi:hypothetical protein
MHYIVPELVQPPDGRRGGEIDDRYRALFWGNRKELGEPCEERDQAVAPITDAGRDETGMKTIGSNPRLFQPSSEFARKKNVA